MEGYGCRVYARGLELHTDGRHRKREKLGIVDFEPLFPTSGGPRGAIKGFSTASRRRLAWTLANAPVDFATHITLTYHARVNEADGDQVAARNRALVERAKTDLNRFLACLRAEIGAYCWVQEFQKRGAIHFHVLGEHDISPERVAVAWCRATGQLDDPHALKHAVRVRRVEDQTTVRRYLVKYFGKAAQKSRPPGVDRAGRYWGAARALQAEPLAEVVTCQPKARRHERSGLQVRRALQRFVSKCVGFKWRGGRLTCWRDDVPERALRVVERLRSYYRETGYVVAMAERLGWEFVGTESRWQPVLAESPASIGSSFNEAAPGEVRKSA